MTRSSSLSPPRSLFASSLPLSDTSWVDTEKYNSSHRFGSFEFISCYHSNLILGNVTDYLCNLAEKKVWTVMNPERCSADLVSFGPQLTTLTQRKQGIMYLYWGFIMYYEFIMQLLGSESPLTSFLPSFSPRLGCRNAQTVIAGTLRQATAKVNSKSIALTALCS